MKKQRCIDVVASVLLAATLAAMPAYAADNVDTDTAGTDVWISAIPRPSDERISVTVPMMVGFVVNGTNIVGETQDPITVEKGALLLPKVLAAGGGTKLETVSDGSFVIRNYSTNVPTSQLDSAMPPRYGISVKVTASLTGNGRDDAAGKPLARNDWILSATEPNVTDADFKKYRIGLDTMWFEKDPTTKGNDITLTLSDSITLEAPPSHKYGWNVSGTSKEPSEKEIALKVQVGGTRGMYTTPRDSVKAAMITWTLEPQPLPGDDQLPNLEFEGSVG